MEHCEGDGFTNPKNALCAQASDKLDRLLQEVSRPHILYKKCIYTSPRPNDGTAERKILKEEPAGVLKHQPPRPPSLLWQYVSEEEEEEEDGHELMVATVAIVLDANTRFNARRRRGSVPGRQVINRDIEAGHARLFEDYFAQHLVYGSSYFRRRFRMSRPLFLRIVKAVQEHDSYFVRKKNVAGKLGLSSLQKATAVFRMLTYGVATDATDEYVRIGGRTALDSMKAFVRAIIEVFGDEYLRAPNEADIARLLAIGESRGFPGMLGSIDCMHWGWKNCPSSWQGMYTGHVHEPTIILGAVASQDLWIWHAFFGLPSSLNDINVLHRSPIFARLAEGQAPEVNFTVNGNNYTMGYYLADGIYPQWATLVKTIPSPLGQKNKYFAKCQEAHRKDVERAFGVLQARFAIVRGPARMWDEEVLHDIITACVIMHNMIVEDERDEGPQDYNYDNMGEKIIPSHAQTAEFSDFIQNHLDIRNAQVHSQLKDDLVEHLWQIYGAM
ncbi:uncharacterized protein LOC100826180 isoform X2 [Brachypodium distachyon]|nr:uncharacterized protein LOC100826180 isoform X2 [Brachypodium distachyon]|eukprot:XP_024318825.1 uncharacterized protein LOC100826180 isoform X2 [Brachypodium distachyon]